MTIIKEERIGGQRLILGDCLKVMPLLDRVDAVVTDPPYGMNWSGKITRGMNGTGKKGKTRSYDKKILNDSSEFDPSFLLCFGDDQIIFGFNHYPDKLKKGSALVWIKRYDDGFGSFLSDAEIAYFSSGHGVYCFRDLSKQAESKNIVHPTQKPIPLIKWCLGFMPDAETILDPFMGSGTTLVACEKLGRNGTGIELDPDYWSIACERVHRAWKEPDLFIPEPKQVFKQGSMFDE